MPPDFVLKKSLFNTLEERIMSIYNCYLSCENGCLENNKLYVIHRFFPMLLKYDMNDFSYEVVTYNVMSYERAKSRVIALYKNENIFHMATVSKGIIEYDMDRHAYKEYDYLEKENAYYAQNTCLSGDIMYIFPYNLYNNIKLFDIKKNVYLNNIKFKWKDPDLNFNDPLYGKIIRRGKKLFAFPFNHGVVICFSLEGDEICKYELSNSFIFDQVICYDDVFYITAKGESELILWTPESGIINKMKVKMLSNAVESNFKLIIWSIFAEKYSLLFIPTVGGALSLVNLLSGREVELDASSICEQTYFEENNFFSNAITYNREYAILLPNVADGFLKIDIVNGKMERFSCELNKEDLEISRLKFEISNSRQILYEENKDSLKKYIECV